MDPFSHIFKPLFALRGVWWTLCAHFRRRIHKIESVAEMIKEAKDIRFNPFKIDMLLNSHTIQKALCITKHISHYVSNLNLYESTKTQSNVHALDFVQHGPPFFFSWGRLSDIFVCCFFFCRSKCANLHTFDSCMNLNAFGFFGQKFKLIDGDGETEKKTTKSNAN